MNVHPGTARTRALAASLGLVLVGGGVDLTLAVLIPAPVVGVDAGGQQLVEREARLAVGGQDVGRVQEAVAALTEVDERSADGRLEVHDASAVDVVDEGLLTLGGHQEFADAMVLADHGHALLLGIAGVDQDDLGAQLLGFGSEFLLAHLGAGARLLARAFALRLGVLFVVEVVPIRVVLGRGFLATRAFLLGRALLLGLARGGPVVLVARVLGIGVVVRALLARTLALGLLARGPFLGVLGARSVVLAFVGIVLGRLRLALATASTAGAATTLLALAFALSVLAFPTIAGIGLIGVLRGGFVTVGLVLVGLRLGTGPSAGLAATGGFGIAIFVAAGVLVLAIGRSGLLAGALAARLALAFVVTTTAAGVPIGLTLGGGVRALVRRGLAAAGTGPGALASRAIGGVPVGRGALVRRVEAGTEARATVVVAAMFIMTGVVMVGIAMVGIAMVGIAMVGIAMADRGVLMLEGVRGVCREICVVQGSRVEAREVVGAHVF